MGIMPVRASTLVLLPLPERPTNAQEEPEGMVTDSRRMAGADFHVYAAVTASNTTVPPLGQP